MNSFLIAFLALSGFAIAYLLVWLQSGGDLRNLRLPERIIELFSKQAFSQTHHEANQLPNNESDQQRKPWGW